MPSLNLKKTALFGSETLDLLGECKSLIMPALNLNVYKWHDRKFDFVFWINRLPRVHISEDEEGGKEIELSDDPYDCMRLNVENVPCIVTLCKVPYCIHHRALLFSYSSWPVLQQWL